LKKLLGSAVLAAGAILAANAAALSGAGRGHEPRPRSPGAGRPKGYKAEVGVDDRATRRSERGGRNHLHGLLYGCNHGQRCTVADLPVGLHVDGGLTADKINE